MRSSLHYTFKRCWEHSIPRIEKKNYKRTKRFSLNIDLTYSRYIYENQVKKREKNALHNTMCCATSTELYEYDKIHIIPTIIYTGAHIGIIIIKKKHKHLSEPTTQI